MKSVICAIVKNEQPFIREWAEYHLQIGFDKLYIYEDYKSDSHLNQLEDLVKEGKVELTPIRNNVPILEATILTRWCRSTQNQLYKWFLNECKKGNIDADWAGFFDIDEFVTFDEGWNLEKLEDCFKDTPGILLSWKVFGANGHIKRPEGNVRDNYTSSMPNGFLLDEYISIDVKSLVNIKNCKKMNTIHIFDGCVLTDKKPLKNKLCFEKAWINHYYSKSWEDYLNRIYNRGNMQNNFRSLDQFFKVSPEFEDRRKQMIEEQRYRHTFGTMWISRKYKIISGGNVNKLKN